MQVYASPVYSQVAPKLLLATHYQVGDQVDTYLISEKYDGVRAYWDGKMLLTRQGHEIHAPHWFTNDLPKVSMDGELWMGYGTFDALSAVIRTTHATDAQWRTIVYQVFELPGAKGDFAQRAQRIKQLVEEAQLPHLKAVTQFRLPDDHALQQRLKHVVKEGAEGLMLHRADAQYTTGRSSVLRKLKPVYDAEAKVIAHLPGKGKHTGKLGALLLETADGIRFKVGTGLSDAQREHPPLVGSTVTYTYHGLTPYGKPKFASFLRLRQE